MDATVAGTFSGYELNPESGDPNFYVPGYAGSSGVLRVYFDVQRIWGERRLRSQRLRIVLAKD